MRDDYKIEGKTGKVQIEIEQVLLDRLQAMSDYTKLSVSEMVNTALKRFVSQHKDFMPPSMSKKAG